MGDSVKQMLTRLIQLTDQIVKAAKEAGGFQEECAKIASGTEKLVAVLHRAARPGSCLYERPVRLIICETEQVLQKALSLILKCKADSLMKRVFSIIPTMAFRDMCSQIGSSFQNFLWLLRISSSADVGDEDYIGLPSLAANEPILALIWEQIAILYNGLADDRSDAAASLISLISDNDRYCEMVIQEGGPEPLLKLVKDGNLDGQKNAAKAIGLLARVPDCVDQLLSAGLCSVFEKILKEGPMVAQAVVAWAVSELSGNHLECRDAFTQNNIMRLLVSHLAFETVHDHSKYAFVINKATSVRAVVNATANRKEREKERALGLGLDDDQGLNQSEICHVTGNQKPSQQNAKDRELEDPATKAYMKAMAARALSQLVKRNPPICKSISESRALMCFVALLQKGAYEVRFNSAIALMEITAVAEKDADLRRSVFKPNYPLCKAVIDQLLGVIEKEEDCKLLVPCIKAVGNLATVVRSGTRISTLLVKFLDEREEEVTREAIIALAKLACPENYLHIDHSKSILSARGDVHLIQIVYFGENDIQLAAVRLLCYISRHVPDSKELADQGVFGVLSWSAKQDSVKQDQILASLVNEAITRLEPYSTYRLNLL